MQRTDTALVPLAIQGCLTNKLLDALGSWCNFSGVMSAMSGDSVCPLRGLGAMGCGRNS